MLGNMFIDVVMRLCLIGAEEWSCLAISALLACPIHEEVRIYLPSKDEKNFGLLRCFHGHI
jgi:hypothetical protein